MKQKYTEYYSEKLNNNLYPAEFVTRALLSRNSPLSQMSSYLKLKALDIGFGDGRNFGILNSSGFNVYGTEIARIVNEAKHQFKKMGIDDNLVVGEPQTTLRRNFLI